MDTIFTVDVTDLEQEDKNMIQTVVHRLAHEAGKGPPSKFESTKDSYIITADETLNLTGEKILSEIVEIREENRIASEAENLKNTALKDSILEKLKKIDLTDEEIEFLGLFK